MDNMNKNELHKELTDFENRIENKMLKEINSFSKLIFGLIISIWVVTLITASTLYIITH